MRRQAVVVAALVVGMVAAGVTFAAVPEVRVLLVEHAASIDVEVDGPHRGYVGGVPRFDARVGLTWPLRARDGRLVVDGHEIGASLLLRAEASTAHVHVAGRAYRGVVRVIADGDTVTVVNELDIESYLRGVVPAEMHAVWPMEALRAQAIAARTYTLAMLDATAAWDVCATDACQMYAGIDAEHPRADRAVADTAGLVLTYGGELARTYYHADSGGMLASSAEVWGRAIPYLPARSDVPASSPYRSWQVDLDPVSTGRALATAGYDVGDLTELRTLGYSASGRVVQLEVRGTLGRAVLAGSTLRDQLRAWGLKSTRFRVVGGLRIRGDGWGHGVGMSQYGARSLAMAGYPYPRILAFYYPETHLRRLAYDVF